MSQACREARGPFEEHGAEPSPLTIPLWPAPNEITAFPWTFTVMACPAGTPSPEAVYELGANPRFRLAYDDDI